MKKTLLALALAMVAGGAQAVPLSDLLTGGSITVGDKLFDRFSVMSFDASDPARSFNPANIDVTGIDDGGDYGLRFTVNQGELTVSGDGLYAFVDMMFGFRASVTDPGMAINGVSLAIGGSSLSLGGGQSDDTDSGMYILESVGSAVGTDNLGSMFDEFSVLGTDPAVFPTGDSVSFNPRNEVWIAKNILVWSSVDGDTADLNGFSQRFSQVPVNVPEPATLALVGLGLAGLGFLRRKA